MVTRILTMDWLYRLWDSYMLRREKRLGVAEKWTPAILRINDLVLRIGQTSRIMLVSWNLGADDRIELHKKAYSLGKR